MSAEYESLTPSEGALAGGSLAITGYGLVVIVASAFADTELVPTSEPLAGALLAGLAVGGALLGAAAQRVRR